MQHYAAFRLQDSHASTYQVTETEIQFLDGFCMFCSLPDQLSKFWQAAQKEEAASGWRCIVAEPTSWLSKPETWWPALLLGPTKKKEEWKHLLPGPFKNAVTFCHSLWWIWRIKAPVFATLCYQTTSLFGYGILASCISKICVCQTTQMQRWFHLVLFAVAVATLASRWGKLWMALEYHWILDFPLWECCIGRRTCAHGFCECTSERLFLMFQARTAFIFSCVQIMQPSVYASLIPAAIPQNICQFDNMTLLLAGGLALGRKSRGWGCCIWSCCWQISMLAVARCFVSHPYSARWRFDHIMTLRPTSLTLC